MREERRESGTEEERKEGRGMGGDVNVCRR